jgi:hypothetical protein
MGTNRCTNRHYNVNKKGEIKEDERKGEKTNFILRAKQQTLRITHQS